MVFVTVLLRRLLAALPLVLMLSVMVFVILRLLPADPIAMLLPPNATQADAERLRAAYGLDQPIWTQYLIWLRGMLAGDFGTSLSLGQPVAGLIAKTLPATLELVFTGGLLGIVLGGAAGLLLFGTRETLFEHVADIAVLAILSVPDLLWAILLLILFGVVLSLLPFMGRMAPGHSVPVTTGFLLLDCLLAGDLAAFRNALSHMVLPSLAIGLGFLPVVARVLRAALLETTREDYVAMARLRGLSRPRVLVNYELRNAAVPTVSLIGVQLAFLMGGTMMVEVVFSYPGLGNLMVEAVRAQDLPLIQGVALVYCVLILGLNALVDAAYTLLNPRLRSAI